MATPAQQPGFPQSPAQAPCTPAQAAALAALCIAPTDKSDIFEVEDCEPKVTMYQARVDNRRQLTGAVGEGYGPDGCVPHKLQQGRAFPVQLWSAGDRDHVFVFGGDCYVKLNPTWWKTLQLLVSDCVNARPEAFPPGVRMDELCVVRRWYTPEYYTHWQYCLQRPPGDLPSNAWGRQERYDLGNLGHRLLHVAFDQLYDSPSVLVITPLIEVDLAAVPIFVRPQSHVFTASAWLLGLLGRCELEWATGLQKVYRSTCDWSHIRTPLAADFRASCPVNGAALVHEWFADVLLEVPAEPVQEPEPEPEPESDSSDTGGSDDASDSGSSDSGGRLARREHEASLAARMIEVAAVMQAEEGAGGALVGLHGLQGGDPIVVEDD